MRTPRPARRTTATHRAALTSHCDCSHLTAARNLQGPDSVAAPVRTVELLLQITERSGTRRCPEVSRRGATTPGTPELLAALVMTAIAQLLNQGQPGTAGSAGQCSPFQRDI